MVYKLDTRAYPPARHTDYLEYCSSFHWTLCSRALVLTGPYPSPQLRLLFTHWGDYDLILLGYHLGPYILVGCSAPGFYEIVSNFNNLWPIPSDQYFYLLTSFFLSQLSGNVRVWPYSLTYFRTCFTGLADFFELSSLHLVPYSLRRGGATHFYGVHKALDFVMIQGRWNDQRTARQYLDDARATLITLQVSPTSTALLSRFRQLFLQFVTSLRK